MASRSERSVVVVNGNALSSSGQIGT